MCQLFFIIEISPFFQLENITHESAGTPDSMRTTWLVCANVGSVQLNFLIIIISFVNV